MVHFEAASRAIACIFFSMNHPGKLPTDIEPASNPIQRLRIIGLIMGYVVLVLVAWITGSDVLSAICVVLLVSAILSAQLRKHSPTAWFAWLAVVIGVLILTVSGHGRIALDLVPLVFNLGLAILFGRSLTGGRSPLIARAIVAIEGAERLQLPRVETYARLLTLAWTVIFAIQVVIFILLLAWWLPTLPVDSNVHRWAMIWLHVGGYSLPAFFMLVEFMFRRWYLRHIPHASPALFIRQLAENWPKLLRDTDLGAQRRS